MISDPGRSSAISSLGWVDRDAPWRFDAASGRAERIRIESGARHLSLHTSGGPRFIAAHHFDGKRFELTVHDFADPARTLASGGRRAGRPTTTPWSRSGGATTGCFASGAFRAQGPERS